MKKAFVSACLLAVTLSFTAGCVVIGNRGSATPGTSVGQQLMDLQKARDTGAISEAEFQTLRNRLVNPEDKP